MSDAPITRADFDAAGLSAFTWRDGEIPSLVAGFRAESYTAAAAFALEVARAADAAVHHPDIDVRYQRHTRIVMTTHRSGGPSWLDLELAAEIERIATANGVEIDPDTPR